MNKWKGLLVLGVLTTLFAACQKSSNNSPYPQISFKSLTPDSVIAGSSTGGVQLSFDYMDGDGDLGSPVKPGQTPPPDTYIYLIDSRDSAKRRYLFPEISNEDAHNTKDGITGNFVVSIFASTLIPRLDTLHFTKGDTVKFTTYIVDEAGHESNRFTSPNIYIRPR